MPRKGQRIKHRKPSAVKPPRPAIVRAADPIDALPLTRYMALHFEWMLVKGYAEDTVRTRRIAVKRFIRWCFDRGLSEPGEITKPIIDRYQRHLFYYRKEDGRPMTIGSQFGCLQPLRTFFKWLTREHHIPYNPASELELPKQGKRLPRSILTVQEIEAILNEAEPATAQGLRDRAMLETLYSTGLRRMELTGLALYDVDLARGLVRVREGKGRKDRVVPIGARACAWVDKYLIEARPEFIVADSDALFLTDYGEPVSAEYLANKVKRYFLFAKIAKPGACHLFRHACATHMLEGGADIRFIQAMLGHANLQTTEIYTHVSIDKLKEIHAATHPARLTRASSDAALEDEGKVGLDAANAPEALWDALDGEAEDDEAP